MRGSYITVAWKLYRIGVSLRLWLPLNYYALSRSYIGQILFSDWAFQACNSTWIFLWLWLLAGAVLIRDYQWFETVTVDHSGRYAFLIYCFTLAIMSLGLLRFLKVTKPDPDLTSTGRRAGRLHYLNVICLVLFLKLLHYKDHSHFPQDTMMLKSTNSRNLLRQELSQNINRQVDSNILRSS